MGTAGPKTKYNLRNNKRIKKTFSNLLNSKEFRSAAGLALNATTAAVGGNQLP